jgi:cytochrome P450
MAHLARHRRRGRPLSGGARRLDNRAVTISDGVTVRSYPFAPPEALRLHPMYGYLRAHEPLARVRLAYGDEAWLVTGYHNARAVLTDPRFSRAPGHDEPRPAPVPNTGILALDPPEHTRLRRLVAKAFTAHRVETLRAHISTVVDGLLDAMVAGGAPADLVADLAIPLPLSTMCELLGVPFNDRQRLETWSEAILSATSLTPAKIGEYVARLRVYMTGLVRRRRADPTDVDLIGALVRARDDQDRLSDREILDLTFGLLAVGYETTAGQLANFVYVLHTQAGAWDQLRARPDLVSTAVEELMRFVPNGSFASGPRYATADVQLDGGLVRAGEPVLVYVAAANRDERVFADPDRLDLTRSPNPHLAFGHGIHHCLGAPLARMELQECLSALLRRLPTLRLAVRPDEVPWKTGMFVRRPAALPVTWSTP